MNALRTAVFALALALPALAMPHGPGGMGNMGGTAVWAARACSPSPTTAASSSPRSPPHDGRGQGQMGDRELLNITPSGQIRWRVSFDNGWPMLPVNDGDLVVLALREDWWMGVEWVAMAALRAAVKAEAACGRPPRRHGHPRRARSGHRRRALADRDRWRHGLTSPVRSRRQRLLRHGPRLRPGLPDAGTRCTRAAHRGARC